MRWEYGGRRDNKEQPIGFWQNREIILKSNVTLKLYPRVGYYSNEHVM